LISLIAFEEIIAFVSEKCVGIYAICDFMAQWKVFSVLL
jgi:hypothetical protein